VLLLILVIVFLNLSAILLLKEDKRAYVYQSQSTAGVLASKEFTNNARHALDTLRLTLASVDPKAPMAPQAAAVQSVLDNQSEVLAVSVSTLDAKSGTLAPLVSAKRAGETAGAGETRVSVSDLAIEPDWLKTFLPELLKNGYGFTNLSKLGGMPVLGVAVADLKLKDSPSGMPVAIGAILLKEFASELAGLNLTVATRAGWVLFDTDSTVQFSRKNISDDPLFDASSSSRVASGAYEYDNKGVHFLGSYVYPGLELVVFTRSEWKKAIQATYTLTEKFILLGFMAVGSAIVFAILFSKTLTAPINRLYEATKKVAQGDFALDLKVYGRDEIGALTDSFNAMSKEISGLIKDKVEKAQLENELAIASTVQATLIPPAEFSNANISLHSHYESASQCGGDWWGFFGVGNRLAVMIADATGHGFPSALITASARSCFSIMHKIAQEDPDFSFSPSAMLDFANRTIFDASMGRIMMTFFIGVFDFDKGTFSYSNAGHNPPWLFKKNGGAFKLQSLTAQGQRLGEGRDCPAYEEREVPVSRDDVLFLYTDGLMEGTDAGGEQYGKKRTRKTFEEALPGGALAAIEALMKDFKSFNGPKAFDDDVTIAVATILNTGSGSPGASEAGSPA
jgi:serine phosphatase RsbU (regulator of sigma subunit)